MSLKESAREFTRMGVCFAAMQMAPANSATCNWIPRDFLAVAGAGDAGKRWHRIVPPCDITPRSPDGPHPALMRFYNWPRVETTTRESPLSECAKLWDGVCT